MAFTKFALLLSFLGTGACAPHFESAPPAANPSAAPPSSSSVGRAPELPPSLPPLPLESPPRAPSAPDTSVEPDPTGAELAEIIAARLLEGEAAPGSSGLPAPRSERDNNPFALVRPADEIAAEGPEFVLSPSGREFAFVRAEGGKYPELWIADRDGDNARLLVDLSVTESTLVDGERGTIPSESLFAPSFSADGRSLYFQTDGWATSLALYSVRSNGGGVRFVKDANGYFVIRQCRRRSLVGSLIAYRHSYSELPASAVDWYFLLDPGGKQLGVVGDGPESVDRFLEKACGLGRAPEELKGFPGCDGQVLRYEPKRFLDGGVLELFYWVSIKDARRPFNQWSEDWLGPLGVEEARATLEENCAK
ncbi:TolB family protein [Sorangium sp. So ce117]|uniref:TolB family protein n=1 Tax=Sorangium sp. So ce117 TaxID=3133277 RepID=UPI003F5FC365